MFYNRKGNGLCLYEQVAGKEYKHLIFEKYGVFDGCEEIAYELEDYAKEAYSRDMKSFAYTPSENCLANEIEAIFVRGRSCTFKSNSIISSNGKYSILRLNIGLDSLLENNIFGSLMHELVHAYENARRIEGESEDLKQNALKTGYNNVTIEKINTYNGLKQHLARLLYHLTDFERNAYIAQIYGDIKSRKEPFDSLDDALKWIYGTVPYHNYMVILDFAERLANINDEGKQAKILEMVNELSNHNFKNYNQFTRWLKNKVYKYNRKFQQILPKIAADNLNMVECFSPPIDYLIEQDFSFADITNELLKKYNFKD